MISKKMTKALNKQINAEIYSAYLYLSMSAYASVQGLAGVAKWFFIQNQEEMTHALRLYNYVNTVGEHVILETIEKPPTTFKSAKAMFEATLKHEKKVTGMINNLVNVAISEKDHATEIFLQWFVSEQVEEEEGVNNILAQLKLADTQSGGLFIVDKDLATRAFNPPIDIKQLNPKA